MMARKSTIKKKNKKNKEKTSVKYIALPATLPSGLKKYVQYIHLVAFRPIRVIKRFSYGVISYHYYFAPEVV